MYVERESCLLGSGVAPGSAAKRTMDAAQRSPIWHKSFPYRNGDVVVTRIPGGWQIVFDGKQAEAKMLVDAFEVLLKRKALHDEMRVVVAALAWDRVALQQSIADARPGKSSISEGRQP